MSLIGLLVILVVFGVLLYVVNTLIPMDAKVKTIVNIVAVLALCLWVLQAFGLIGGLGIRLH